MIKKLNSKIQNFTDVELLYATKNNYIFCNLLIIKDDVKIYSEGSVAFEKPYPFDITEDEFKSIVIPEAEKIVKVKLTNE